MVNTQKVIWPVHVRGVTMGSRANHMWSLYEVRLGQWYLAVTTECSPEFGSALQGHKGLNVCKGSKEG